MWVRFMKSWGYIKCHMLHSVGRNIWLPKRCYFANSTKRKNCFWELKNYKTLLLVCAESCSCYIFIARKNDWLRVESWSQVEFIKETNFLLNSYRAEKINTCIVASIYRICLLPYFTALLLYHYTSCHNSWAETQPKLHSTGSVIIVLTRGFAVWLQPLGFEWVYALQERIYYYSGSMLR